jgi:hypothetical protein
MPVRYPERRSAKPAGRLRRAGAGETRVVQLQAATLLRRRPRLDGVWNVVRTGGLLPPMLGVHKVIEGTRGRTNFGPLPGPAFEVRGRELHYARPFGWFVDVLTGAGANRCSGRATVLGWTFGTFEMTRVVPRRVK